MKLKATIDELESWIPKRELTNSDISKSSVGWQIGHSLQVLNSVVKLLPKSNPKDYKWKFSFYRTLILTVGKIPRGKAKAPRAVRPEEQDTSEEELRILVEKVRTRLDEALKGDSKSYFDHPYFGLLDLKTSVRFMEVHTKHHLDIIRDIANKK
jgi:hypothetical protein